MKVKRIIENYNDFLAALDAKKSEDAVDRNEAKNALGNFRRRNPELFDKYTKRYEGIEEVTPIVPEKQRKPRSKPGDKEKYIREHPEISVIELRKKARERLLKTDRYGIGLALEIPSWVSQNEILKSLDNMTIADLITASGNPVPRQTLIRKCLQRAVSERRIDEKKLRYVVFSSFCNNYKVSGYITLASPDLYEPIKRVLREETTIEELVNVSHGYGGVDVEKLVQLINSKEIKVTDADRKKMNRKASKEAKKKKLEAKREARKKEALERKENDNIEQ